MRNNITDFLLLLSTNNGLIIIVDVTSINNNNYELKKEINKILQNYTTSIDTTEIPKKYLDIIKAQFGITKIEGIERRDDDTISAKDGDFTSETIYKLIKDGYESTWRKYPPFILQQQQQK